MLINEKEKNIKEENEIKKKIDNISQQVNCILIKLKKISVTLESSAKNKNHLMTENDLNEIGKMVLNKEEQMKELKD